MTGTSRRLLAGFILAATTVAAVPAVALDAGEKEEIGAFIREYLIANPEIMIEVQQALQAKQMTAQQEQASQVITARSDAIFNAPTDIALGNPEGEITVVEFFDYNCGYCKSAHEDMKAIIGSNEDVRFVLKEFPILGPDSLAAHRVSMALKKVAPGEYAAFQNALMSAPSADEATALAVAAELGVDEAALREAMQDPAIDQEIRQSYELADALGITGTPTYIVGDEAVFGAMGAEVLNQKIDNIRDCGSATC